MKWKIDFDDLEDSLFDLDNSVDVVDDFLSSYGNLVYTLLNDNQGKFFDAISDKIDTDVSKLEELRDKASEVAKALKKYISDVEGVNPWTGKGTFKVDKDIAEDKIKDAKKLFEDNFKKKSYHIKACIDEFEDNIRKYNHIDATINEHKEYADEPELISHIHQRRKIIDQEITDFKKNDELLEEAIAKLEKLEDILDDFI